MQATITSKGQITLPKTLREQLHLAPGDRVELILEKSNVLRIVLVNSNTCVTIIDD